MNYLKRREKLINSLKIAGIENIFIQDLDNIYYLTGFSAAVMSRPFGLVLNRRKHVLIVPATAADSAKIEAQDVDIEVYYECPVGKEESLSFHESLDKVTENITSGKMMGVEADKISLTDLNFFGSNSFEVQNISPQLLQMRTIKELEELHAIRLSANYVDFIVEKTIEHTSSSITEIELDQLGAFSLRKEVAQNLPSASAGAFIMTTSGTERTVMPHSNSSIRQVQTGDSLILCRQVAINGYRAQCDRMVFVGKPSKEQEKYYSLVLSARAAAIEIIRPGIIASDVDKAIRDIFQKEGLGEYFVHRSGSGLGISIGEAPYLRFDSQEKLESDMVLVIQPAIYIPGVGGFRCSDTVIVQEDGCELITQYPRDIQSLTV